MTPPKLGNFLRISTEMLFNLATSTNPEPAADVEAGAPMKTFTFGLREFRAHWSQIPKFQLEASPKCVRPQGLL